MLTAPKPFGTLALGGGGIAPPIECLLNVLGFQLIPHCGVPPIVCELLSAHEKDATSRCRLPRSMSARFHRVPFPRRIAAQKLHVDSEKAGEPFARLSPLLLARADRLRRCCAGRPLNRLQVARLRHLVRPRTASSRSPVAFFGDDSVPRL